MSVLLFLKIVAVLFFSNEQIDAMMNYERLSTTLYYDKLLFNLETRNKSKQVNIPPV